LKLHYRTIGTAKKNEMGVVGNAVLVLHGTGGSGASLLRESFADVLFAPGRLLDASRYYIILPDGIGHGRSSKPSDGLHARFPRYDYDDMVLAQYRLLTEKLGVGHLRLIMGTSMGGMHTWVWGETYPDFMDALMPLASLPVEIAGRNRMQRRMILDAIRSDPDWKNGDYQTQPRGLVHAVHLLILMGSSPLQMQKAAPTGVAADKLLEEQMRNRLKGMDANDLLYQVDASRAYNPAPGLGKIQAPLLAINSADDEINPPELGILEREIRRVPRGRFVLIPTSDKTRGHGTHSFADIWKEHLAELLEASERK
jgi:homoserine O-acetyltransferase